MGKLFEDEKLHFFYAVALELVLSRAFFRELSGSRLAVRHDCISSLSLSPVFWQSWPLSTAFRVVHTVLSTNARLTGGKKSRGAREG